MAQRDSVLHSLRFVAGCSLLGTVVAGTLFGWLGAAGVHEAGALLGAGLGAAATLRHVV